MKVLFLQFASPSFEWEDHRSNVPLAAGNLAAFARQWVPGIDVEILDRGWLDRAGDAAAARAIADRAPDVVAATLYCWSSFRTLDILERARRARPGMWTIVGGPEVDKGNDFLRAHAGRAFDAAASGEGEELFVEVLTARARGESVDAIPGLGIAAGAGEWNWNPARAPVNDLTKLPSPYVEGLLPLAKGGIQHVETARGCVFECDFCFYHADFRKVRIFPLDRVGRELKIALDSGVKDLYLMDPTFNGHAGYRETLRALRPELLHRGARVHTELRAEPMNAKNVRELADAGITSVEVGLQTTTPAALAAVGRTFERERFARGCLELTAAGIDVEIGTIVGLPGDSLDGVRATFEYARDECGADPQTVPFILSLLPATVLRERAATHGLRYRQYPPYTLVDSPTFPEDDIRRALELYTEVFDRDLDSISTVRLTEFGGEETRELADGDLLRRVFVDVSKASGEELANAASALAGRVESTFGVVFRGLDTGDWTPKVLAFLRPIREANPHGLLEVVFELDGSVNILPRIASLRAALPPVDGHYLNEHLRHMAPPGADLSLRFAVSLPIETCDGCGRGIAERLPVLWRVRVNDAAQLGAWIDGPGLTGALHVVSTISTELSDLTDAAGEDALDMRAAESSVQRALDRAAGRPPCPPETVAVLGARGAIVAVRRRL